MRAGREIRRKLALLRAEGVIFRDRKLANVLQLFTFAS